jgi:CHAT domain-containing protein
MLDTDPASAGYVEVRRGRPAAPGAIQSMIANDLRPAVVASLMPLGPDQLAVIALRSDSTQPVIACQPADIPRMFRFITENLGTAGRVRELATDLEDLFHHELEPLTRVLSEVSNPGEILIACAFGALNYVPLAALRVGGTDFAERNPLVCLPNASLARALRMTRAANPEVPAIVFGDPAGDLPGALAEAAAIASIFGTTPVLGEGVSRAAVRSALTRAGIVHVGAHAYFSADAPLSSGLRLCDGVLAAEEIMRMSTPALSLVTLSACETGVSEVNDAQELLGLLRALLFAGADSLIVSLWKVPDAATAEIMSDFYGQLGHGTGKADALRAAVLRAREKHGTRFDRWAGFELVGEWR